MTIDMGLSDESKKNVSGLWYKVVDHRFVSEMREGTLGPCVFNTYFDQDYLSCVIG
jgi:thiaminase